MTGTVHSRPMNVIRHIEKLQKGIVIGSTAFGGRNEANLELVACGFCVDLNRMFRLL
jgi:hypothetical protein